MSYRFELVIPEGLSSSFGFSVKGTDGATYVVPCKSLKRRQDLPRGLSAREEEKQMSQLWLVRLGFIHPRKEG